MITCLSRWLLISAAVLAVSGCTTTLTDNEGDITRPTVVCILVIGDCFEDADQDTGYSRLPSPVPPIGNHGLP
jgi:hypothetical protein